jgi:hypothetical protein
MGSVNTMGEWNINDQDLDKKKVNFTLVLIVNMWKMKGIQHYKAWYNYWPSDFIIDQLLNDYNID